jgi:hypothetical protein
MNIVRGWMQDTDGNSDTNAPTDSLRREKFSAMESVENFIRSNLRHIVTGARA